MKIFLQCGMFKVIIVVMVTFVPMKPAKNQTFVICDHYCVV